MTNHAITNRVASVKARLQTAARERGQPFDVLLTRYVLERLLYRLSTSGHRDRFVLKGAVLVTTWFENPFRPTRDLDLLGFGDPAEESLLAVFREICAVQLDDGVVFDAGGVTVVRIRRELDYGGMRLETVAFLDQTRVKVSVDVAFGDAVEPGLSEIDLPVLLDQPAPRLRAYARETVIAEKFQAIVSLGRANTRMKDYYDIWMLSRTRDFSDGGLDAAIAATFERRKTEIPEAIPDGLSEAFAADASKRRQWSSFIANIAAAGLADLTTVVTEIAAFLMPHAQAARRKRL